MIERLPIPVQEEEPPALLVVIDTEEEFDWHRPLDRQATSVKALSQIHLVQDLFDTYGITPTYVVDWPVASQEAGFAPLKSFADAGRAVIGTHLHPWVSPPYEEDVTPFNSFPGNLPRPLEAEKLHRLSAKITDSFGHRPLVYKAGRYGLGPHTAEILAEQGYLVDLSACPAFDYSPGEGGPDYSNYSAHPYWFGPGRALLGLPRTGAFVGYLQRQAGWLYPLATHPALRWAKGPGILSRLGALDRLGLSPEGYDFSDLKRLTDAQLRLGVRTFSFCFHSPSVMPGCTPFVSNQADLEQFLDRFRHYFDYFLGQLKGVSWTPLTYRDHLIKSSTGRITT
ncbi:MAG: polysaccharide deacetylase family protein [Magnetococcales bacterium]|nr:polysaccharide deacetylase family protein [Magnetococcales bacterium]